MSVGWLASFAPRGITVSVHREVTIVMGREYSNLLVASQKRRLKENEEDR